MSYSREMTATVDDFAIVVRWQCCEGMLGIPFRVLAVLPERETVTCLSCGAASKVKGPLLKYRVNSDYLIPAAWVKVIVSPRFKKARSTRNGSQRPDTQPLLPARTARQLAAPVMSRRGNPAVHRGPRHE